MNRRGLFALAAGMLIDRDRLLWRPGVRLISIPKPTVQIPRRDYYEIAWPLSGPLTTVTFRDYDDYRDFVERWTFKQIPRWTPDGH